MLSAAAVTPPLAALNASKGGYVVFAEEIMGLLLFEFGVFGERETLAITVPGTSLTGSFVMMMLQVLRLPTTGGLLPPLRVPAPLQGASLLEGCLRSSAGRPRGP